MVGDDVALIGGHFRIQDAFLKNENVLNGDRESIGAHGCA
jgi:hypothetical protein